MLQKLLTMAMVALVWASPVSAQTVDEIIAKNLQARGGLEKLQAVKALRMSGTITVGPGVEAPFVMEFKRPNQMRLDVTMPPKPGGLVTQATPITQAYDGKTGWMINPMTGRTEAVAGTAEAVRMMEEQADWDGPLVDYKAKGHSIELLGKESVDGREAYKLQITFKNGDVRYYYLDAERYLEVRVEGRTAVRGSEVDTAGVIGDYRDVDGIMIPHLMESGPKGAPQSQKQKMTVGKVELNVPIDDSRFRMPGR